MIEKGGGARPAAVAGVLADSVTMLAVTATAASNGNRINISLGCFEATRRNTSHLKRLAII
jgi:hypothetical protein